MSKLTWEEAVRWLREQPDEEELVKSCYYDDPLLEAARRYAHSDEWQAVRRLVSDRKGRALDFGAGRGICSYALAVDGWEVTACEPDPSSLVGAEAIRTLAKDNDLSIRVVNDLELDLRSASESFDLIYARSVLHHVPSVAESCRAIFDLLRKKGLFLACREHVISKREDLGLFLDSHPLHHLYGGEKAFLLGDYLSVFQNVGFKVRRTMGPFDSPINYFPLSRDDWRVKCIAPLFPLLGYRISSLLASEKHVVGRGVLGLLARRASVFDSTPGRMYSFVLEKE